MDPAVGRRPLRAEHDGRRFLIVPDLPEVGIYLHVYEGDLCVRDDLQNDISTCIRVARERYGVPTGSWMDVPTE